MSGRDELLRLAADLRAHGYDWFARWVERDAILLYGSGNPADQPRGFLSMAPFRTSRVIPEDEAWLIDGERLVKRFKFEASR